MATQGEVLQAQRRVSGEGPTLIWVGVGGECPAWQRSALASCGNAVLENSEALGILGHGARSGSAAEALQGTHGADVVKRRRRLGDDDPGRLVQKWRQDGRHALGRYSRQWVATEGCWPVWCNGRQAQHLDQYCAGRGHQY